jgi:hypothetical protein
MIRYSFFHFILSSALLCPARLDHLVSALAKSSFLKLSRTLRDFAPPDKVAEKVVGVELSKEGVFEAKVLSATESPDDRQPAKGFPCYDLSYRVGSSRGNNHYDSRTTVVNGKLYVLTVQSKEEARESLATETAQILDSWVIQ